MLAVLTACSADPSASYLARDPCEALVVNTADASPLELDGITAAFALWRDHGVSAFDSTIPSATPPVTAILDPTRPDTGMPDGTDRDANRDDRNRDEAISGGSNLGDANPGGANAGDPIADNAPSGAIADAVGPIEIRFGDAAETFHGVYDPSSATITINRALTDRAALAIVIAHELGHVFGLAHVAAATRASLMNPGNLATPPTDADRRTLEALWGTCRGAAQGRGAARGP